MKVNIEAKFSLIDELWKPHIVGEVNGQEIRLARLKGEFEWHSHDDADEFFLVIGGSMTIHLRDRDVELDAGEFFVVPRGVDHKPEAVEEARVLLVETAGTRNTGSNVSDRTLNELERL